MTSAHAAGDRSADELQAAAHRHLWLHFTRMSSYAGTEVKLGPAGNEQELLVMSEDEVLAIIE